MDLTSIVSLPGYEDIARLLQEWDRVAKRQKGRDVKVPLPNYYLTADEGFDFGALFDAIAQYLEERDLLEFDGRRKVYSFYLQYSPENVLGFDSFRMLYTAVEHELAKFGHPYGGILVVDITEWVESRAVHEKKFNDFLSYMSTHDDRTLTFFLDRSGGTSQSDEACHRLDLVMRLERLHMAYRDPDMALKQLEGFVGEYGFHLAEAFRTELRKTVETLLVTPGAEGEESVRQMAQDMVYSALKGETDCGDELSAENSADFLPGGKWAVTFAKKYSKRLGLVGEED